MGFFRWLFKTEGLPGLSEAGARDVQGILDVPLALRRVARTPLAEARAGEMQRFRGEIALCQGEEPLIAPLTQRECVYYELTVEQWRRDDSVVRFANEPVGSYEVHLFDWGGKDFELVDGEGRARVHQRRPSVLLQTDRKLEAKIGKQVPDVLQTVIDRLGPQKSRRIPRFKGTKLLVREGVLEVGERVDVWAIPTWKAGGAQAGYREAGRELWLEGGDEAQPNFVITDRLTD